MSIYAWYFGGPTRSFLFIWRQGISIALNRFFPDRFSSPYGEIKIVDYVPKSEKSTAVKVLRGVVKEKDLPRLAYAIDVSGSISYIQFDEDLLRTESQHVLIPYLGNWQSIAITPQKPINLLCTGDVVEIRIDETKQLNKGASWESPLSPTNVIVVQEGRSCLPREADTRRLPQ